MKHFEINSIPLKEVVEEKIKVGEFVCDNFGRLMQKIVINGNNYMMEKKDSPLIRGELLDNLTEQQLDLFWKILKNGKN